MVVAVGCALAMTGLTIRREFFSTPVGREAKPIELPAAEWTAVQEGSHRRGPPDASLVIVEYADFQCPFCKMYNNDVLRPLAEHYPNDVAVVFRHWPLPTHPYAMNAAILAECAAEHGAFWQAHDLLYELSDSLEGLTPLRFAELLGFDDTESYQQCAESPVSVAKISADSATIIRLGGRGTPAVIVDGVLYDRPPTLVELTERITLDK
jgi:protein-disulfide isomerase